MSLAENAKDAEKKGTSENSGIWDSEITELGDCVFENPTL